MVFNHGVIFDLKQKNYHLKEVVLSAGIISEQNEKSLSNKKSF